MLVLFLISGQIQSTELPGSTSTYSRGGLITLEVREGQLESLVNCCFVGSQKCNFAKEKFYELFNVFLLFFSESLTMLVHISVDQTQEVILLSISELSVPLGGKAGWPSQVIGQSTFFLNKNSTSKFFHKGDVSSSATVKNHSPFVAAAGMATVTHQEDINITQKIDDLRAWLDSAQATSAVLSNANK